MSNGFKKAICVFIALFCISAVSGCGNNLKTSKQEVANNIIELPSPVENASLSTINGELLYEKANAIRTKSYIGIDDFEYITIADSSYFKIFAYSNIESESFKYLGCTEWISDSLARTQIQSEYPDVTDIRIEIKVDTNKMQTLDAVNESENTFLVNGEIFNYQIGTIFAADGVQDLERDTRFFTDTYLSLDDFSSVALKKDYSITWFAYSCNGTNYDYLGTSDWLFTGYFSCDSIRKKFPTATHFRFAIRCVTEEFHLTDSYALTNVVETSGIRLYKDAFIPQFELGEISEKEENAGQNDDESISRISDTIAYDEFIDLETMSSISLEKGLQLAYYAFSENKEYLGYSGWYGAQVNLSSSDVIEQFHDARYIKLAIRTRTGEDLQYQKGIVSFYDGTHHKTTYAYYRDLDEDYSRLTCNVVTKLKKLQDGSIYNDMALCMGTNQTGLIYSTDNWDEIAKVTLNGTLRVHCNSVCFGKNKFDETDDFPLLYCNVYNSYASEEDRKEGVCGVYRLVKQDNGDYIGNLIQVIEIGFTEDLTLWKSKENNQDIRPYGNFVVDSDNNNLYVNVPRDADEITRYFCFELPDSNAGTVSQEYQVRTIVLNSDDVLSQFDERYTYYPQGIACYNGKIYLLEGMKNGKSLTKLSILDLSVEKICGTIDLDDMGITVEPEMVAVDGNTIYLTDIDGVLYEINIELDHTK